ncbi:MAG: hypothetical protein GY906_30140 [bacterium]|nr:hypothetical protein [bacterium]
MLRQPSMHPKNLSPSQEDEEWDPNELHRSREHELQGQQSDEEREEYEEFVDGDPVVEEPDDWGEEEPEWD